MRKSKLFVITLIFLLVLSMFACSSNVNVNDVSKKSKTSVTDTTDTSDTSSDFSSDSSSGATSSVADERTYSITIKGVSNGSITAENGVTEIKSGESVTFIISAEEGYEVAWIKINEGNDLKSKISKGKLTVKVTENIVVSALFCLKGEKDNSSYKIVDEDAVTETYSVIKEDSEHGDFKLSAYSGIKAGEKVYIQEVIPESGYGILQVLVTASADNSQVIAVSKEGDKYVFTMPAYSVKIKVEFGVQAYAISVNKPDGVEKITLDKYTAYAGETVKITEFVLKDGYNLVKITANETEVTDNQFIMPANAVTVNIELARVKYAVNITANENANILFVGESECYFGDTVKLTITALSGYKIKNVTVTDSNSQTVDITINGTEGTFTMPACSVTVAVETELLVYSVNKTDISGVTYSVDKTSASMGDTITISDVVVDSTIGITLKGFKVNEEEITGYTFTMPAKDVTIEPVVEKNNYSVTVASCENGTVSVKDGLTYNYGDKVVIIVEPSTDYQVDTVTVTTASGKSVSVSDFTFTMPAENVTITATFKKAVEKYTVTVNSCENGNVTIADSKTEYVYGESVTLTISPAENYELKNLTVKSGDNIIQVTDNTFTVPQGNITVDATFVKKSFVVSVNSENGNVDINESYTWGETVTFNVTPNDEYTISSVSLVFGETTTLLSKGESGYTFTMPTSAVVIKVEYAVKKYALTISSLTGGTVTLKNQGNEFAKGEIIELVVSAQTGYSLKSLTYNGISVTDYSFTMPSGAVTVDAVFEKLTYNINISYTVGGTVTCESATAEYNQQVVLNITAETGSSLIKLTVGGSDVTSLVSGGTYTFNMPADNVAVEATFGTNSYAVTINSGEGGTVKASADNATYGEEITLTVTAKEGYVLDSLTMNGSAITNNKFTMPAGEAVVKATFKLKVLTITGGTCENGTVLSATSVDYNTQVTFTATADSGYELDYFAVDGIKIDGNTYTVTKDITVTAVFKAKTYNLTIVYRCQSTNETLKTETQQMSFGTSTTITPTQTFDGYTMTTKSLNVTMDEEGKTVYVEYTINTYTLTVKHLVYGSSEEFAETETYTLQYKESKTISPVTLTAYNGVIKANESSKNITMGTESKTETFTYSLDTTNVLSTSQTTGALKVISASTGFSVSYKLTDNTSYDVNDWCLIFSVGKSVITAGCMQWYDDSGNLICQWCDGRQGHGNNDVYGPTYNWDAVIKEGCSYTLSVNTDGTMAWYRDGLKVLYFDADTKGEKVVDGSIVTIEKTMSDFVTYLISKVNSAGITTGDGIHIDNDSSRTTLSDITIGYPVTEKTITINYSATDESIQRGSSVYKLASGYAYTFNTALSGFTASADSVTTTTGTADETFAVTYTRNATTEKAFVSTEILVGRKGAYGTDGLISINNISGDFYMEISIKDLYQMQSASDTWRCILTSLHSSGTSTGRYFRFDRYSWFVNNSYGEWTQGHSTYSFVEAEELSASTQMMKGKSDLTITISRVSGTVVIVYKIYSYVTDKTYYMDFTCENMSGAVDVSLCGEDCTYTLKSIKVENNSTGELSVNTSKIGTTVYNGNESLGWGAPGVRTSYEGFTGNFAVELDLYQSAVENVTDMSYSIAKWRTPILAIYAYGDYTNHTVVRQDGHFWTGTGQTVGNSVTVTSSDSTLFLGDTDSTSTTFADIVKNAYVKIVVVGENVGTDSGKVYVTYYIYSLNPDYSNNVYRVSYEVSGVTVKSDIVVLCESSTYTVYSAVAKQASDTYSHDTGGWTKQIDYQPTTVLTGAFEKTISYTSVINGERDNGNWTTPLLILYDSDNLSNRLIFRQDWWAWQEGTDISGGTFSPECSRGHSFAAKVGIGETGADLYDLWKACYVKVKITRDSSNKVRVEMTIYGVGGIANVWYDFSSSYNLKVAYSMEKASLNIINGV